MPQMLLFADPRPLVERLGVEFFQQAPERPGVYLMRDAAGTVLYVGKAKNLRKRLGSYRVANPDRLARRQLRLLRAVARIEMQECDDESCALARESELLRELRPRFNRAGTWLGPRRFVAWRGAGTGLEMAVVEAVEPGWVFRGPMGAGAFLLRDCLVRLCWCGLNPERGMSQMPAGWFRGRHEQTVTVPVVKVASSDLIYLKACLNSLFAGETEDFMAWIRQRTGAQQHPFELAAWEANLETVSEFAGGTIWRVKE
jgi:predicted GIY-YIG superfamily endonuclease